MNHHALLRHIVNSIAEWDLKMGVSHDLWLNYPLSEVEDLLGAPFTQAAQKAFCDYARPTLGEIEWVDKQDGFCRVHVPRSGVDHVKSLPVDPFLADLVALSKDPFCTLDEVDELFARYPHEEFPLPDDADARVYHRVGDDLVYVFDSDDGLVEYHRLTVLRFRRLYGEQYVR